MCPSVSRLDQCRMGQLPSYPQTHPEGPGEAAPHALHMFLQFKEGADLHEVVNFNTFQSSLWTFQTELTADSFIKRLSGCFKKPTGSAFRNGSLIS